MTVSRRPTRAPSLNVILLLGPDDENCKLIRNAVSDAGHRVLDALNREQAERMLRELDGLVDLILGCVCSDAEAVELEEWNKQNGSVPLLTMRSKEEHGSTFLRTEMALRVRLAHEAAQRSRSIVVVDENEHERKEFVGLLQAAGYSVRQAASGKMALALLAQRTADACLPTYLCPRWTVWS